ncbi:MAG: phosphoribosyltransferase, partial [Spirochaetaceae bacterium]|nr:phosphoribosyltransferase [Spirochaetaceae bacterium]
IKIAVHDYKVTHFRDPLPIRPDYWWRKMEMTNPQDDTWIHYLSHELEGLTDEEIEKHYLSSDPDLRDVFDLLKSKRD